MFNFVLTLKGLQKFLDRFKFTECASNLAFCSCITLNNNLYVLHIFLIFVLITVWDRDFYQVMRSNLIFGTMASTEIAP